MSESLSRDGSVRPIAVVQRRLVESFDITEHRVLSGFLARLEHRVQGASRAAAEHIRAIEKERPLRDVRIADAASLFVSQDLPKIARLRAAIRRADQLKYTVRAMRELPFIRDVAPALPHSLRGGVFQRSAEYRALHGLIRRYLAAHPLTDESGQRFTVVTKLTSRLFEQWCFLNIVDAFRRSGLELREWSDALRQHLEARFLLDFERGLSFEGRLTIGLRVRIRYEPWILSEAAAASASETLFRAGEANVAWSPDIVIELLREVNGGVEPLYAVVLDAKYTRRVQEHHWTDTRKYLQIRGTRSRRQLVRQLWLIAVGEDGIASTDPAVEFGRAGPTAPIDEPVLFVMTVMPGSPNPGSHEGTEANVSFDQFAAGTMQYFRREFV